MPVTLYHLNPETERIGVCRAEQGQGNQRRCPFGSENPHFGSKADAQSYYENALESEYGLFGEGSDGQLSLSREAVARRLNLLPEEALKGLVEERWRRGGWTAKETEQQLAKGEPFYVHYSGNQEITLELDAESTQQTFTKGACSVMAYELNRATGWPVAIFTDASVEGYWQGHVAVRTPDGSYLDATGLTDQPLAPYGGATKSWTEEETDTEGLIERMGKRTDDGQTEFSKLPLLERFAVAKLTYDLLDREGLLTD